MSERSRLLRPSTLRTLLLATVAALPLPLQSVAAAAQPGTPAPERIIVRWRDGVPAPDPKAIDELSRRTGRALTLQRHLGGRLHLLAAGDVTAGELPSVLEALRADPRVAIAEPDRRVRALEYLPNDPLYQNQWYLKDGQPAAIRANFAWLTSRGGATTSAAPVVAVIDTGVRFEHPDLRRAADGGKLLPGFDFISADPDGSFSTANDGNGWDTDASDPGDFITAQDLAGRFANRKCGGGPNDDQPTRSSWHGTRVSGLLAAESDNALGMTGAGFNLRILPIRALGKCGGYDSDVLAAMYWAAGLTVPAPLLAGAPPVNATPARVINMSLGGVGVCSPLYAEAVREITSAGVLVVAAAGNDGKPVDNPANCSGVLGVAGLRHVGTKVGYSNLGPEVGIAAPAGNCVNILPGTPCLYALDTTSDSGTQQPAGPTYTTTFDGNVGTSFSSPLVAATAGLMVAANPALTPAKLSARLRATARPFPQTSDTQPQPPQCRLPTGSTDVQDSECLCTTAMCGAGMLDAAAAVRDALRPVALATASGGSVAGSTVRLDGSASRAATGRSLATFQWAVVPGGTAAAPSIDGAQTAVATLPAPASGTLALRLTVTDDAGATDSVEVSVLAATSGGGSQTTAPPATAPSGTGGGGGRTGLLELLLLAATVAARAVMPRAGERGTRAG